MLGPAPRMAIRAGLVPTFTLTWLAVSVAEVGAVSPVTSTTYSVSPAPVVGPRSVSRPPPLVIVIGPGNAVASIVFALAPPLSSAASIPSKTSVSPAITSVVAPSCHVGVALFDERVHARPAVDRRRRPGRP